MENNQNEIVCTSQNLIFAYPTENEATIQYAIPCEDAKVTPFILNKDWTKMKNLLTGEIYELNLDQYSWKSKKQLKKCIEERLDDTRIIREILKQVYGDNKFNYVTKCRCFSSPVAYTKIYDFCFETDKAHLYCDGQCLTTEDVKTLCDKNNEYLPKFRANIIKNVEREKMRNAGHSAQDF